MIGKDWHDRPEPRIQGNVPGQTEKSGAEPACFVRGSHRRRSGKQMLNSRFNNSFLFGLLTVDATSDGPIRPLNQSRRYALQPILLSRRLFN
jgi:hypothetical protein